MSFEKLIRIPTDRIGALIGKSGQIKSKIEQLFKQYKQVLHEMKNCGNWENTVVEFRLSSILKEEWFVYGTHWKKVHKRWNFKILILKLRAIKIIFVHFVLNSNVLLYDYYFDLKIKIN